MKPARPQGRTIALRAVAAALGPALSLAFAGCGSDQVTQPNLDEAGEPAPVPCGAVEQIPATIIVAAASGQAVPCNATFTVAGTHGAIDVLCGGVGNPCEEATFDAGMNACPYSLNLNGATVTVTVNQAGYQPVNVPNVFGGVAGCVTTPTSASTSTVTLVPLGDGGGVDAGRPDTGKTTSPDSGSAAEAGPSDAAFADGG